MRRIRSMRPASWFIQKEVYKKIRGMCWMVHPVFSDLLVLGFLIRSRDILYHDLSEVTL